MNATQEKMEFQAETKELLDLMIHSLYSSKDIFLRELISNASDALDKRRFESLQNPALLPSDEELGVRLDIDPNMKTLTISDNGIGMSRDEVIQNIGTIAHSGTRELLTKIKGADKDQALDLIGQFGVGFYSAFMVAKRVELHTRRAGAEEGEAICWRSEGDGTYTIDNEPKKRVGTRITLFLKDTDPEDGIEDFTQDWTVRGIVKKYSDFVTFPIKMKTEKQEPKKDEEGKVIEGEYDTVIQDDTLNSQKAIWSRNASDVSDEEYNEFYRHVSHDWNEPAKVISQKAEGTVSYESLLFFPKKKPMDWLYDRSNGGLQLFVKKVMIMEKCEELLPRYLRFVKGVVESSDLPLNVSREILQQNRQIQAIQKGLVKKVLRELKDWKSENLDAYTSFWKEFGVALKEGIASEFGTKEKLEDLLLFESSNDPENLTDLAGYVERMPENQKEIYYITGEDRAVLENSPNLEAVRAKGFEVIFLTEPVDEFWLGNFEAYQEKKLVSAAKEGLELDTEEEKEKAEQERKEKSEDLAPLLESMKTLLEAHVAEVRVSSRLTESPACLVVAEKGMTPQMERLMKQMNQGVPQQKRIMEVNPNHTIIGKLKERLVADANDASVNEYTWLLLDQALLAEGSPVIDNAKYGQRISKLMTQAL